MEVFGQGPGSRSRRIEVAWPDLPERVQGIAPAEPNGARQPARNVEAGKVQGREYGLAQELHNSLEVFAAGSASEAVMDAELFFDIFRESGEKDAELVESVPGLLSALHRIEEIAAGKPGRYFLFDSRDRSKLVKIDSRKPLISPLEKETA